MKKQLFLLLFFLMSAVFVHAKDNVKRPDSFNYLRGLEALQNQNMTEGVEYLKKELEENPKNGYAYCWLALVDRNNGDNGSALANCDRALKYLPKKDGEYVSYTHLLKAQIFKALEEYDKALTEYAAAIKADPLDVDQYNERGQLYLELGQYDLSDADYRRITELEPSNQLGYTGLARNLIYREKYAEAIPVLDYAVKLADGYGYPLSLRAKCYMQAEDWGRATDDIVASLEADGDDTAFQAIKEFKGDAANTLISKLKIKSVKNTNENKWPYYLGNMYETLNDYPAAVRWYRKVMDIDPVSVAAERIAHCYQYVGLSARAIPWIDRAQELAPDDDDLIQLRADVCADLGDTPGAIAQMDIYVEHNPESALAYFLRGAYKKYGRLYDEAIEDYDLAVALAPEAYPIYLGRADAYVAKGDTARANADYRRILEIDTVPNVASVAFYALAGLGRTSEACEFMDSVIASDPDEPSVYYQQACLYSRLGDKERALDALRTAFDKGFLNYSQLATDHDMDILRDDERYKALLDSHRVDMGAEGHDAEDDDSVKEEVVCVPFTREGGVCKVKCDINGLPLHFIFDTGATDVTISMVEANFMLKNDYLKSSDIVGNQRYMDANGDVTEGTVINLARVTFGGLELPNVRASVVRNQKAPLLLGQSVLARLGKIEIDNQAQQLKITHKVKI